MMMSVVPRSLKAATGPSQARASVLVVDGEPRITRSAETALRRAGFQVATAPNGDEALRAAARCQFDLVVLDVTPPPPDGWETLRRLLKRRPRLKILVASPGPFDRQARLYGAVGLIRKPFDDASLVTAVDAALKCPAEEPPGQVVFDVTPDEQRVYEKSAYEGFVGKYNELIRRILQARNVCDFQAARRLEQELARFWPHPQSVARAVWVTDEMRRTEPLSLDD
jgi:DNA-binding response OmpR family regulator